MISVFFLSWNTCWYRRLEMLNACSFDSYIFLSFTFRDTISVLGLNGVISMQISKSSIGDFWVHSFQYIVLTTFVFPVYRFSNPAVPKLEWEDTLNVKCGWGKEWEPAIADGCVDPRGCQPPPPRTSIIWGSFEDSDTKVLDVGTSYWYSCRLGLFMLAENNFTSYLDLECINDPEGGPPFWSPPFDNDINPFPTCVTLGKLSSKVRLG